MSDILVRDLDSRIVNRLKTIAKSHGRSLQGEVKAILVEAASFLHLEAAAVSERWHQALGSKKFSDSSKLVREDRER